MSLEERAELETAGNGSSVDDLAEFLERMVNIAVPAYARQLEQYFGLPIQSRTSPPRMVKSVVPKKAAIPDYKMEAIYRSFSLEIFSVPDIAYFLGLSKDVVARRFKMMGQKPKVKTVITSSGGKVLTFRLASQIYEVQDTRGGDFPKKISELLGTNTEVVHYAIWQRPIIEPRIIEALRVLYGSDIRAISS